MAISSNRMRFVFTARGPTPARCRSAALRLAPAAGAQNSPGDFDALASLAWRRKPDQLSAALTFWRRLRRKQMTRKPREIGVAVRMLCLSSTPRFSSCAIVRLSPSGTVTSALRATFDAVSREIALPRLTRTAHRAAAPASTAMRPAVAATPSSPLRTATRGRSRRPRSSAFRLDRAAPPDPFHFAATRQRSCGNAG